MAALQSPFYGEKLNLISLCQKIVSCNYPPLVNNYSVTLRALVASCLDSDPKKRPDIHTICEIAKMCSGIFIFKFIYFYNLFNNISFLFLINSN